MVLSVDLRQKLYRSRHVLFLIALVGIAAAVRAVFLFKDSFATGFDGYYYALQVRSLMEQGRILNADTSIVYRILRLFGIFSRDIVLSNKIAVIILCSSGVLPFYLTLYGLTGRGTVSFLGALVFTLSFSQIYMSFEIIKNGIGFVFLLWSVYFLLRWNKGAVNIGAAAGFGLLALLTHKVTGGIAVLFFLLRFGMWVWDYARENVKRRRILLTGTALGAAGLIGLFLFVPLPLRLMDLARLFTNQSRGALSDRFSLLLFHVSNPRIQIELILLHSIPLCFLPLLIVMLRDASIERNIKRFLVCLIAIQAVLLYPFLEFTWVAISYRFLLCSSLIAVLELGLIMDYFIRKYRRPPLGIVPRIAAALFTVLFLLGLPGMYNRFHFNRYPDYKTLYPAVMKIPSLVNTDSRLIAYFGLSYFIWYSTGIYTQHFVAEKQIDRYVRVSYGIGPVHLKPYIKDPRTEFAIELKAPYYLVSETVWQRYYRANRRRLKLLHSWMNPYESRPDFVYYYRQF